MRPTPPQTIEFTKLFYDIMAVIAKKHFLNGEISQWNDSNLKIRLVAGLIRAMQKPAEFLQHFKDGHFIIPNTMFLECHCSNKFSRQNPATDARALAAGWTVYEAMTKQEQGQKIHIAVAGSGFLADTIFLIAALLRNGITNFKLDLIDLMYSDSSTVIKKDMLKEIVESFIMHLTIFFGLNAKVTTEPSSPDVRDIHRYITELAATLNDKSNNTAQVGFFSNLTSYHPTTPVIMHEVDLDTLERERLVNDASTRLPMNSIWIAAFKDRTVGRVIVSRCSPNTSEPVLRVSL